MQLTKEKIEAWKAQYGAIQLVETNDGKKAVIWEPTQSLKVMKQAMTALQVSDFAMVETILSNCWVDGDESIKQDKYYLGLASQMAKLLDLPDAHTIKSGDHYLIEVPDRQFNCKVRPADRGALEAAKMRNGQNKPFDTNIYLLERIWADTDKKYEEIRKDDRLHMAILTVMDDVKEDVGGALKKL